MTFLEKLISFLPSSWFGTVSNLSVYLNGPAKCAELVDSAIQEITPQLRIRTATGGVLDLMSGDFFGTGLLRLTGESDDDYRARILVALFRELATKRAMSVAIAFLTGYYPLIREKGQTVDPAGYVISEGTESVDGYGTTVKARHCFIEVYQLAGLTYPSIGGYGYAMGYSTASRGEYISLGSRNLGSLFELINAVRPIGTKVWVKVIQGTDTTLVNTYGAVRLGGFNTVSDQYGIPVIDDQDNVITDATYT